MQAQNFTRAVSRLLDLTSQLKADGTRRVVEHVSGGSMVDGCGHEREEDQFRTMSQ